MQTIPIWVISVDARLPIVDLLADQPRVRVDVGRVRRDQRPSHLTIGPALHLGQVVQLRRLVRFQLLKLGHVDATHISRNVVLCFTKAFVAQLIVQLSFVPGWLVKVGGGGPPDLVGRMRLRSQITFVL